jgi:hypothetical protein
LSAESGNDWPKGKEEAMTPTALVKRMAGVAVLSLAALAGVSSAAQEYDPPPQAGRLSAVKGEVSFQQAGGDQWMKARRNMPLGPGDRLYTDEKGRAEIQIGQTFLRVGPDTDITLQSATPGDLTFALAQGSAHLHALGLWQGQSIFVNTPSGSVALNTASQVRVDVYPAQQAAIFTDLANAVQVSGAGDYSQGLQAGQALELAGTNPVTPQWLAPAEQDDLDRWSYKRDREIAQATAYQYVSPQMSGAEELDAYGTWTPGTPYGAVWYPNDVPPGWVPYRNGYWVNRAPWGWVWVEDEPWGYAPSHYGRWVNWNGRWAWVPGPRTAQPVWAPAQVAFVGGVGAAGTGRGVLAVVPVQPGICEPGEHLEYSACAAGGGAERVREPSHKRDQRDVYQPDQRDGGEAGGYGIGTSGDADCDCCDAGAGTAVPSACGFRCGGSAGAADHGGNAGATGSGGREPADGDQLHWSGGGGAAGRQAGDCAGDGSANDDAAGGTDGGGSAAGGKDPAGARGSADAGDAGLNECAECGRAAAAGVCGGAGDPGGRACRGTGGRTGDGDSAVNSRNGAACDWRARTEAAGAVYSGAEQADHAASAGGSAAKPAAGSRTTGKADSATAAKTAG